MGVRGIEIPDMLWTERKGSMYLLEPELAADAVVGEDPLTTVAPEGGAQHFRMFQCQVCRICNAYGFMKGDE